MHGKRRVFCDFRGERNGFGAQRVRLCEHVRNAPGESHLAIDPPARLEQQSGTLLADQSGECVGEPKTRMKSQLDEVGAKARLRTDHTKIRQQRKSKTATNRCPLNSTHNRLLVTEQSHGTGIQRTELPFQSTRRGVRGLGRCGGKVVTRAKILALTGQHNRSSVRILIQLIEHISKTVDQVDVKEVVWWPCDFHNGHVAVPA